jgi:hypothetical protein
MPVTITRDQLAAMKPCDLDKRLALFGKRKSLTVAQALKAGATVRDILWVAGRLGLKAECAAFALACARRVETHATDPRVKACNDANAAYQANPTQANLTALQAARSATATATAYATYTATYTAAAAAAYATYTAAAYAAAATAAAAAYAAAATAAAATAAAATAAAYAAAATRQAELAKQRAHLIKLF